MLFILKLQQKMPLDEKCIDFTAFSLCVGKHTVKPLLDA